MTEQATTVMVVYLYEPRFTLRGRKRRLQIDIGESTTEGSYALVKNLVDIDVPAQTHDADACYVLHGEPEIT